MALRHGCVGNKPIAFFLTLFTLAIICARTAQAADDIDQSVQSARFKSSVGVGIQYGGAIGWQGSIQKNSSRFRLSLGFVGVTPGYDYLLSSNVALGAQIFTNQFITGAGLNLTYFFNSYKRSGWLIGIEAHRAYDSGDLASDGFLSFFDFVIDNENDVIPDNRAELENRLLLSVGYQF